jgi:hypothetical protein
MSEQLPLRPKYKISTDRYLTGTRYVRPTSFVALCLLAIAVGSFESQFAEIADTIIEIASTIMPRVRADIINLESFGYGDAQLFAYALANLFCLTAVILFALLDVDAAHSRIEFKHITQSALMKQLFGLLMLTIVFGILVFFFKNGLQLDRYGTQRGRMLLSTGLYCFLPALFCYALSGTLQHLVFCLLRKTKK